jgi:molybdenum cofactor cytidylyltransferase
LPVTERAVAQGPIVGVILAAGSSSRLGRPKQLLPLGGRPVLAHTLANASAAALDAIIVVLGHEAATIQEQVDLSGALIVINEAYREGQSTSLRAGLAALPPNTDAALFILGDQPLLGPAILDALIAARRSSAAPIVMPTYAGQRGNPVLIASALFPELATVTGDQGARGIIRAHAAEVQEVPITGDPPTDDLDTQEDYDRLLARYAALHDQP